MNAVDFAFFLIEIVGTVAFAISGAMIAIERNLALFGVLFLNESIGLRSACGIVLIFAAALLLYFTKDKDKVPKNA